MQSKLLIVEGEKRFDILMGYFWNATGIWLQTFKNLHFQGQILSKMFFLAIGLFFIQAKLIVLRFGFWKSSISSISEVNRVTLRNMRTLEESRS